MKRLTSLVFGAAFAAVSGVASVAGAEELKLAHFMSTTHPYHEQLFVWLSERVAENSGGDLTVRIYPGGELGTSPAEQFNRAVDGVADLSFIVQGYTANAFPGSLVMELPGVLEDASAGPAAFERAAPLIEDEYRRVHVLGLWNISPSVLFMRDTPVTSLEDLAGLKIRVASRGAADLVEAWGATPVFMPVTEMYTALQTGVVDGTLGDAGGVLAFRLNEVTRFMTRGFDSTVTIFGVVMNRDAWNGLSAEDQAALASAADLEFSQRGTDVWAALSTAGSEAFANTAGNEIHDLSPEAAAAFNEVASSVREASLDALEANGVDARAIMAAMRGN